MTGTHRKAHHVVQREIVQLVDDIDARSEAAETVTFGLDGVVYEIDLTEAHAADLRDELDAYVAAARRISGPARRRHVPAAVQAAAPTVDYEPAVVRQWAQEQGIEVSPRGRVSNDLIEQYREARESTEANATAARGRRPRRATR